MNLSFKQYRNKPVTFEVIELTRENLVSVATWCGGRVNDIRNVMNDNAANTSVGVPSLYGTIDADIGTFVVRNRNTGAFGVMTKEHLEKEYERFGLRQDGPFLKIGNH